MVTTMVNRLRERMERLIRAAGLNQRQAAHAIGCTPSRLGDYLSGRVTPSALVLLSLEDVADQAQSRQWMRAADVVDAVAAHHATDPELAFRLLLQGRDQSVNLSTPARQALWASGHPTRTLSGPWKVLTHAILRGSAEQDDTLRPIPRWLAEPMPLATTWSPFPPRPNRSFHPRLRRLGIAINERDLVTA